MIKMLLVSQPRSTRTRAQSKEWLPARCADDLAVYLGAIVIRRAARADDNQTDVRVELLNSWPLAAVTRKGLADERPLRYFCHCQSAL